MVYFTDRIRECAQEMAMMAVRVSDDGRSLPLAVPSKPQQAPAAPRFHRASLKGHEALPGAPFYRPDSVRKSPLFRDQARAGPIDPGTGRNPIVSV